MRLIATSLSLLLILGALARGQAPPASPKLNTVEPMSGKAEAEFTAAGENLDKNMVAELYLTDGKNDIKTKITSQAAAAIKFTAPATIKAGRYSLMLLTADKTRFLEQPVKVTIE